MEGRDDDERSEDLKPKRPPPPIVEAPSKHSAPIAEPAEPFVTRDPKDEDLFEAAVRDETDLYAAWAEKSVGFIFKGAIFGNQHLLISCFTSYVDDVYRRSHRVIVQFFSAVTCFYLCSLVIRESTNTFVVAGLYAGTIATLINGFLGYAYKHFFLTDYDLLDLLDEVHPLEKPRSASMKTKQLLRKIFVWSFSIFLFVAAGLMIWYIVLFCDRSNKDDTNYFWFFSGVLGLLLDMIFFQPIKIWWESYSYKRELVMLLQYARTLEKPRRQKAPEPPRVKKEKPAPAPAPPPAPPAVALQASSLKPLTAQELAPIAPPPPALPTEHLPAFVAGSPAARPETSERVESPDPFASGEYKPSAVLV